MHLKEVIEKAIKNGNQPAPVGRYTLRASMEGTPSHRITNTIAAFRAEMEDVLSKKLEIVGGGAGCVYIHIDVSDLTRDEIKELSDFIKDSENKEYFRDEYQINSLTLQKT